MDATIQTDDVMIGRLSAADFEEDWTLLEGLNIEIHDRSVFTDRGQVEAVTPDGSILWLAQDGATPRRIVEKLPGTVAAICAEY